MSPTDLLLLSLAAWRLTSLLVYEAGPWDILFRLRHAAGVRYDEHSERYSDAMLGKLLLCVWCCGWWVGLAWTALYLMAGSTAVLLALPFALSACTILIDRLLESR